MSESEIQNLSGGPWLPFIWCRIEWLRRYLLMLRLTGLEMFGMFLWKGISKTCFTVINLMGSFLPKKDTTLILLRFCWIHMERLVTFLWFIFHFYFGLIFLLLLGYGRKRVEAYFAVGLKCNGLKIYFDFLGSYTQRRIWNCRAGW